MSTRFFRYHMPFMLIKNKNSAAGPAGPQWSAGLESFGSLNAITVDNMAFPSASTIEAKGSMANSSIGVVILTHSGVYKEQRRCES